MPPSFRRELHECPRQQTNANRPRPGERRPVDALAEVRWDRPFQELDDRPAGLGLRFIDTPLHAPGADHRFQLETLIQSTSAPAIARHLAGPGAAGTRPTRLPRSEVKTPSGSYLALIASQRSSAGYMARKVAASTYASLPR